MKKFNVGDLVECFSLHSPRVEFIRVWDFETSQYKAIRCGDLGIVLATSSTSILFHHQKHNRKYTGNSKSFRLDQ